MNQSEGGQQSERRGPQQFKESMSGEQSLVWRRSVQRAVHLVPAVVLGTFVYAPFRSEPLFLLLVQVIFFPLLVVSGLLMWRGGRLRRWLRARRSTEGE